MHLVKKVLGLTLSLFIFWSLLVTIMSFLIMTGIITQNQVHHEVTHPMFFERIFAFNILMLTITAGLGIVYFSVKVLLEPKETKIEIDEDLFN